MTSPTARMLSLLEILQSGGSWTVGELAARLAVDERTVRRYVAHLLELEVPVRTTRGRYGGYRLAPGFRLPPLMFTDDEAVAVLFALDLAARTAPATLPLTSIASAVSKLRRVLPEALGRKVDALLAATDFTGTSAGPGVDAAAARSLLLFGEAAGSRRPVAVDYTDAGGRRSERVVHPYGLVVHAGRWYVVAADPADGRVRSFRLDRITAPVVRTGTFDVPEGFDAGRHVVDGIARAPRAHVVEVRVQATPEQVRERVPPTLAVVSASDRPGWVDLRLHAESLVWVPALLAGIGHPFVVERPTALRDEIRALARRLLHAVEDTNPTGSAGNSPILVE